MLDDVPTEPFAPQDLERLELSRRRLRELIRQGMVRRVVRGAYAPVQWPDDAEHRSKIVALVVSRHHVVADRTAAWIHGIDTLTYAEHDVPPPIDVCARRGHQPTERDGVAGRSRDLSARDVMTLGGLQVTTPLRTALDLGCLLRRREAKAALDAFCRQHGINSTDLASEVKRFKGRRGVRQLRELIALVDPAAESARESWTKLAIQDAGLPQPESQVWIEVNGVSTYRLDLAYRHRRVAIEYDGFDHHRRTRAQIEHDRERRRWLRDHGWIVIVVKVGDFTGERLERWLSELRTALRPTYSNVRRMERNSRIWQPVD
jgi:hypothetical protein